MEITQEEIIKKIETEWNVKVQTLPLLPPTELIKIET